MAREGAKRKAQSRSTQQAKCVLTDSPSPPQCYEGMRTGHTEGPREVRQERGTHKKGSTSHAVALPRRHGQARSRHWEPGL